MEERLRYVTAKGPGDYGKSRKKLKVQDSGRVCTVPNCSTVLSKYNTLPVCRHHAPLRYGRIRGTRR